jgi:hypothetical protein
MYAIIFLLFTSSALAQSFPKKGCRNIHGDAEWPTRDEWQHLNQTISGRLVETVPLGAVCHHEPFGVYNQTACDELRRDWSFRHWKFKVWEMGQVQYVVSLSIF